MSTDAAKPIFRTAAIAAAVLAVTAVMLRLLGRRWWCDCGSGAWWAGDVTSPHMSQHVFDPYSATHVLHGVLFYGALRLVAPRMQLVNRCLWATALEALWEIVENTNYVIDRYRHATIAVGYAGDSIINSAADILCSTLGFFAARRLGLVGSIVLFVVVELVLLATVRDNLTLNVLMLILPLESVKAWQTGM